MDQQGLPRRDDRTGLDLPNADGQVSDEDVKLREERKGGDGGQDHSLDNYADSAATSGIGNVQDRSDTSSDIAHIEE
jgi:hypothetical protein